MSSTAHILHYWWPRFVGNIGLGLEGSVGERTLGPEPSNSYFYLPSAAGTNKHCHPVHPKCLTDFYFLKIRFSAFVGDTSSTFKAFKSGANFYQHFWNFPHMTQFSLLCLMFFFVFGWFASMSAFLPHLHLSVDSIWSPQCSSFPKTIPSKKW